jgi:hypothetical protein
MIKQLRQELAKCKFYAPGVHAAPNVQCASANLKFYTFDPATDECCAAGLVKQFLRELQEPLIPVQSYANFVAAGSALFLCFARTQASASHASAEEKDELVRVERVTELARALPTAHYATLKFLMAHLRRCEARLPPSKKHSHTDAALR